MSYDISSRMQSRRAMQDIRAQQATDDAAREKFMRMMNNAATEKRITLTDFEWEFVERWAATPLSRTYWTPKRRDVADELKRKYS